MKVLLLEDHPDLRGLLTEHLVERGFNVDAIGTLEEARAALATSTYDLAVVDLTLPDGDGRELLGEMPTLTASALPTIVITARDSLEERLACLNGGADDYLPKPFNLLELEARLRAVLRRPKTRRSYLSCGTLTFDPVSREVFIRGVSLDVNRREADLLEVLLQASGRVIVRGFLTERLYASNERVTPNALEAVVSRLRRRLQEVSADVQLETIRGIGYRLMAGSEVEAPANS